MIQKRIAARALKCVPSRVWLNPEKLDDIKKAITTADVRELIKQGTIIRKPIKGHSRYWARLRLEQKRKSRQQGTGSRKGRASARRNPKDAWMATVRLQRELINRLKHTSKLKQEDATNLYRKSKGGFFRSIHHLKMYIQENGMMKK